MTQPTAEQLRLARKCAAERFRGGAIITPWYDWTIEMLAKFFARHRQVTEARMAAAVEWQDIATAPKDGTVIIASDGRTVEVVSWNPSIRGTDWPWIIFEGGNGHQPHGCCDGEDCERVVVNGWLYTGPTHWQPLPARPAIRSAHDGQG